MNNTIDFLNQTITPSLRGGGSTNSTGCSVAILGWCTFSQGAQAGIILGFIALILFGCCCYCVTREQESDIYK